MYMHIEASILKKLNQFLLKSNSALCVFRSLVSFTHILGHKDHKKDYCVSHLVYIHAHQSINTSNLYTIVKQTFFLLLCQPSKASPIFFSKQYSWCLCFIDCDDVLSLASNQFVLIKLMIDD
jgi:hypothetical protein